MSELRRPTGVDDDVERLRAERDALQAQLSTLHERRRRGGVLRRATVLLLVVLACLSLTATSVAVWANRTLLTTDGWVETIGPLGGDPAVTAALRPRITEAVFAAIPAEELIADALPEDRAFLAAPLSSAVQSFVDDQVGAFLDSSAFETLWTDANRIAHEQVLALLRGQDTDVVVEGDTVTLNLLPTINAVLGEISSAASGLLGRDVTLPQLSSGEVPEVARAKLSQELGVQLPADLGAIPVYQGDEVATAQQAVLVFDNLRVVLLIATPLLIVGALWLSRHRRRTLIQLATGSVLLLVIVRRLTMRATEAVVDLPPQVAGQRAARVVADQLLDGLFYATGAVIVVGLALVVLSLLTGPYGWAVALRRTTVNVVRTVTDAGGRVTSGVDTDGVVAWVEARRSALQLGGVLAAVLLLLIFNLSWAWFLALLALLACFELLVWRLRAPPPPEPEPA